ncbi:MAG UNVERIFIED_CONTAM: hypothetical protein LVQ98_06800 [Rickettsiaceae bacterium]|jgi:hypothetical protein
MHPHDREALLALHQKIIALKNTHPEKHKLIFRVINKAEFTSKLNYQDIVALSDEILEFLDDNSDFYVSHHIDLRELLEGSNNVRDIQLKFLAIISKSLKSGDIVREKLPTLSDEILEILTTNKYGILDTDIYLDIAELILLEPWKIKELISLQVTAILASGITYDNLLYNVKEPLHLKEYSEIFYSSIYRWPSD